MKYLFLALVRPSFSAFRIDFNVIRGMHMLRQDLSFYVHYIFKMKIMIFSSLNMSFLPWIFPHIVQDHSIYIWNLPFNATVARVTEEFTKFGPIKPGGVQVKIQRVNFRNLWCIIKIKRHILHIYMVDCFFYFN